MVTASHNPPDYNGLKFVREQAKPVSGDTGLQEIRKLAEAGEFVETTKKGTVVPVRHPAVLARPRPVLRRRREAQVALDRLQCRQRRRRHRDRPRRETAAVPLHQGPSRGRRRFPERRSEPDARGEPRGHGPPGPPRARRHRASPSTATSTAASSSTRRGASSTGTTSWASWPRPSSSRTAARRSSTIRGVVWNTQQIVRAPAAGRCSASRATRS